MKPNKRVSTPSAIHKIKTIGKSRVGVISTDNSFRVFELANFNLVGGFKTILNANPVNLANADIAPSGAFVSLFDSKTNAQLVYYTKTKKAVYHLKEHQGLVESVCFGPNSIYLATGGQDGKTYLWSMKNGRIVGNLPPHADYVSVIRFSDNGHWLATAGFDKQINVTNISSMSQKFRLRGHQAAVMKLEFISKQRLVTADKAGEIIVWNYMNEKVIARLPKMLDEVTAMVASSDGRFLFAADKTKRITLYSLENYEVMMDELLKLKSECRTMEFSHYNNMLTIGLVSGESLFFDILQDEEKILDDIDAKAYDKAYERVELNPILRYTSSYEILEQEWEFNLELAQTLLQEGKQQEAKEILKPFQVNASKRLFTQKLIKDFVAFEKFKTAVVNKKYPLAYSVVAQYPALEATKFYKAMESEWRQVLAKVKDVIGRKDGEEKANALLMPFKGISSKSRVIQSIFEERQIVALFQKKLSDHNYKDAMLLAKKHAFLTNFEDHDRLLEMGDKLEKQAHSILRAGKYAQVVKICEKLEGFPKKVEVAKELYDKANAYSHAMKEYAEKNFAALYKMMEKYPFLEDAEIVINMEKSWNKRVHQAESHAVKGDVEAIMGIFKSFLKIETKVPKIASILKIAYINQIKKEIRNKEVATIDIKGAVERYIYFFGIEDMISDLIVQIKKVRAKFTMNLDLIMQEGDEYSWVKKELPSNIFKVK